MLQNLAVYIIQPLFAGDRPQHVWHPTCTLLDGWLLRALMCFAACDVRNHFGVRLKSPLPLRNVCVCGGTMHAYSEVGNDKRIVLLVATQPAWNVHAARLQPEDVGLLE